MKNFLNIYKIILVTMIFCVIGACEKEEANLNYDISGDWKVSSYEDYENFTVITKTSINTWKEFNNGDITVSFIKNDSISGIFTGIKVTNSFSGNYNIGSKGMIHISNIKQTMINEPEWGNLFDSIAKAEMFEVRNDQLRIFYNQRKKSITFEKMKE